MVAAMGVALWITGRRYKKRGGDPEFMYNMALWAIPLGIVGARLYHVVTSPDAYFGPDGNLALIPQVWKGGLGIWGGIAFGALGAWIAARRAGQRLGPLADSAAPALLVAQAIGRWGNWFNQELFGAPTTLPWGLEIDAAHLPAGYPAGTLFHPTFLYECLWNLAVAGILIAIDRRFRLKGGQLFGLYITGYCLGRVWIEYLRIDDAQHILGLRLNVWTAIAGIVLGLVVFYLAGRHGASTRLTDDEMRAFGTYIDEDGAGDAGKPEAEDETAAAAPSSIKDAMETDITDDEAETDVPRHRTKG